MNAFQVPGLDVYTQRTIKMFKKQNKTDTWEENDLSSNTVTPVGYKQGLIPNVQGTNATKTFQVT